jgi:hypothetical protein
MSLIFIDHWEKPILDAAWAGVKPMLEAATPIPSGGRDSFHDYTGSPFRVVDYHMMRWRRAGDSDIYYGVDNYPRGTPDPSFPHVSDYNVQELHGLHVEDGYRTFISITYHTNARQRPDSYSREDVRSIIREAYQGDDPGVWEPEYWRLMKVREERKERLAYGIRNRVNGEVGFIIDPEGTHLGRGYRGCNTGFRSNPPPPPPGLPPPPPPDLWRQPMPWSPQGLPRR